MKSPLFFLLFTFAFLLKGIAQNVGISTTTPVAKLHIKGLADIPQLIIDANSTQTNTKPLIKLRKSDGTDLLWIHSDDTSNVFIGRNAGRLNNPAGGGISNSFIGSRAGFSNTTGNYNTAFGAAALFSNSTGEYNTANGYGALFNNTTGGLNTANGYAALYFNSTGVNNTANGFAALFSNTTGTDNTANGALTLYNNTTGLNNTANGVNALHENISGSANTATGAFSLFGNTVGQANTATGYGALKNNISGSFNTANGANALYSNTTGKDNTGTGKETLYSNTTGSENTASGLVALYFNTSGSGNTAFGYQALLGNTTGDYNTAIGLAALLDYNGHHNVGVGFGSNADQPGSSNNTIVGALAHVSGNNDIAIGFNSFTNVNNLALLGSTTTTQVGGYANWSNFSDGRFKTRIDENVRGLDFILRLRPVTYHMDVRSIYKLWGLGPYGMKEDKMNSAMKADMDNAIAAKEAIRMSGFIAQEVEKAAAEAGYDFDGVIKPAHDKDHYRLAYGEFVVPLVKAVQEQQMIIDSLQKQVEACKAEIPMYIGKQQQIIESQQQKIDGLEKRLMLLEKKLTGSLLK